VIWPEEFSEKVRRAHLIQLEKRLGVLSQSRSPRIGGGNSASGRREGDRHAEVEEAEEYLPGKKEFTGV